MKRVVIVGLGNFGFTLAVRLHELGHDVLAIDSNAERVDAVGPQVSRAVVGDATQRVVLEEAGVRGADAAVVSTGDNLAASILALLALRDEGIENIYVKVRSDEHRRIADALGAVDSIFPERESALALASRVTSGKLLQYFELGSNLSLQEMSVPTAWSGRSLRELQLPQRYRVQVVAVHDVLADEMFPVPDPDRRLTPSDALIVAGEPRSLEELASLK